MRYLEVSKGLKKHFFDLQTNFWVIFDHISSKIEKFKKSWKMPKIAFFAKIRFFLKSFNQCFTMIRVEINPWGLQNPFSGKFWYLNMFRTIFGKIEILVFLYPKIPKNQFLGLEISILGRSPAKSAEIWKKQYVNFFQKKNPTLNGYSFLIYPHFCENWPDPKKTTFSHFLQNTVLDPKRQKILKNFEKFRF